MNCLPTRELHVLIISVIQYLHVCFCFKFERFMPTQTKPFGDFASVELLEAPSEFTWKDIAENKFEPEVQIFRCSNFKDSKVYT